MMLDIKKIKNDKEVRAIMEISEKQIEALGFTEHSTRHSSIVSKWAGEILQKTGRSEREVRLVEIAGYLHDIGNSVSRVNHALTGATLAYSILRRMGMEYYDAAEIMMAIGNHDEKEGLPVSNISAALIIADKADVHKSRVRKVRNPDISQENIHDRVNLAAESSRIYIDEAQREIRLEIIIDTEKCPVMDYFEIYFNRMQLSRRAAEFLERKFALLINGVKLL